MGAEFSGPQHDGRNAGMQNPWHGPSAQGKATEHLATVKTRLGEYRQPATLVCVCVRLCVQELLWLWGTLSFGRSLLRVPREGRFF